MKKFILIGSPGRRRGGATGKHGIGRRPRDPNGAGLRAGQRDAHVGTTDQATQDTDSPCGMAAGAAGMMRRGMAAGGAPEWAGQPEEVATLLGMTAEEIQAERQAGKSLAQIAAAKGISEDDADQHHHRREEGRPGPTGRRWQAHPGADGPHGRAHADPGPDHGGAHQRRPGLRAEGRLAPAWCRADPARRDGPGLPGRPRREPLDLLACD